MIDIEEELRLIMSAYPNESFEEDERFNQIDQKLQKQNKLQQKTCLSIEDLVEQVEIIAQEQSKIKDLKQENKMLVKTLMASYDLFSEIILGVRDNRNEAWYQQMVLQSERLAKMLQEVGITVIGSQNNKLNLLYHKVIECEYDALKEDNEIIRYIKVGYIYKGKVIRKAEVIMNRGEEN